jgi:uncharacterized OB-fold protein
MATKQQIPAIDGWFTMDLEQPHLLGSKCTTCATYFFPTEAHFCRNPACSGAEFDQVELSRTGRVWSFTDNRYQPPEPYVSPDPFEPYVIAAVELADEGLVILGQLARGATTDDVAVGDEVELVLETLFEDDEAQHLVWKWQLVKEAS